MRVPILLIISLLLLGKGSRCGEAEKRLLKYLFDSKRPDAHNILERPSSDDKVPLNVYILIFLMQIIDVDEKNQMLNTNVWLDLKWQDYHFQWDPLMYNNISTLVIPAVRVWRPDILLYNSADDKFDATYPANVIVKSTTQMQNVPPGMFKSTCKINIKWYPFDTQKCEMKFGSWTYYGDFINLLFFCENQTDCNQTVGKGNANDLMENGEWDVLSFDAIRHVNTYSCCPETYIDITYYVEIKRRTLYYTFNLIVPCIIISTMALLGFLIPPDAGEKISLGVTILLSLTVFLMMVAEKMPPTSEAIPLIGMYFTCVMIVCSLSLVFTVLVLNFHHCSTDAIEIPDSLRRMVNVWLARLLFMKPRNQVSSEMTSSNEDKQLKRNAIYNRAFQSGSMKGSKSLLANVLDMENEIWARAAQSVSISLGNQMTEVPAYESVSNNGGILGEGILPESRSHIKEIVSHLRQVTNKLSEIEMQEIRANEWKFAARVVDRFCLLIFSFITIISSSAILLQEVFNRRPAFK